jgi:RNA polymerase sigma-70 factor (ECF subfamily)
MDYTELSDADLVVEAKTGSQLAFRELTNRYWPKLERYVLRLAPSTAESEDIVQDAFIKMYLNLQSYTPRTKFSTWVYRITHNTLIDHVRSLKYRATPFFDPEELFPHPVSSSAPDVEVDVNIIRTTLHQHLNEIETKYRIPLVLYYFEDMGYKEISEVLRLPTGTVGIRLRRGLNLLRTKFSLS